MDGQADAQEVRRLYDRLREFVRTNDRAGVEETCRALLRAGRPYAEIVSHAAFRSNALTPGPQNSSSPGYYWGPQWNVRPELPNTMSKLATPASDRTMSSAAVLTGTDASRSKLEIPAGSRRELVQEWQARQQGPPDELEPNRVTSAVENAADIPGEAPGLLKMARDLGKASSWDAAQDLRRSRRTGATLFPIVGLYVGAIAMVSIGTLVFLYLREMNVASVPSKDVASSQALVTKDPRRGGELVQQFSSAQPTAADAHVSASAAAAIDSSREPARAETHDVASTSSVADVPSPKPKFDPALKTETSPSREPSGATGLAESSPLGSAAQKATADSPGKTEATRPLNPQDAGLPSSDSGASQPRSDTPARVSPPPLEETVAHAIPRTDAGPEREPTLPAETDKPAAPAEASKPDTSTGPRPPAIDSAAFLARGDALFGIGDIVSARLFYERAADGGNAQAAIRLGETFDPSFLGQAGLHGVRADPAAALKWYKRARELGASEADILVMSLKRK